jgi:actin-related protein 8
MSEEAARPVITAGGNVLILQLGSAYTRYCLGISADIPQVIPTVVAFRRRNVTSRVQTFTHTEISDGTEISDEATEARNNAVDELHSAMTRTTKRSKHPSVVPPAPASSRNNAFFEDVQVVRNYAASNAFSKLPFKADLNWKWANVDQNTSLLVGDDALTIPPSVAFLFDVYHPIQHGRLNYGGGGSARRCISAIEHLVLEICDRLKMHKKNLQKYTVCLAIPDAFSRREIFDLTTMFLETLGFESIGIHVESVLSCFGAGVSSACVVDIGAQKTCVSCVKDGIVIPGTL